MKLIVKDDRIAATATDDYTGPDQWLPAPEDFDPQRIEEYRVVDGAVVLPSPSSTSQVATQVTMRQARLALLNAGLLDAVETAIASIPDYTQRKAAQIEWEYATVVDRDGPLIRQLTQALKLTEQQVDELFAAAAQV